jgi:hypothetical protein
LTTGEYDSSTCKVELGTTLSSPGATYSKSWAEITNENRKKEITYILINRFFIFIR